MVTVWKLNSRTLTSATIEGNEWLHPATRATESSISLIGCLQGSINTAHSKTSSHQAQHSTSAWVFHLLGNLSSKKKLWHFSRLHWILWRNCGKSQNSMLHHATHVTWQNGMLYNFHAMIHYSAVPLVVMLMSVHLTYCRIFRTYISTNETNKWTNRQKLATRWIWNCLNPKSKQSDKWWYINANVNVKVYNRFASESQTHPEPYGPPGSGCGPSAHHRAQQLLRSVSFVSSTSTASPNAHDAHVFRHFLSNFSMSKLSKRRRTSPGLLTVPQKPE